MTLYFTRKSLQLSVSFLFFIRFSMSISSFQALPEISRVWNLRFIRIPLLLQKKGAAHSTYSTNGRACAYLSRLTLEFPLSALRPFRRASFVPLLKNFSLEESTRAFCALLSFCRFLNLLVGPSGLEPPTSCLSGTRSNLLSYDPSWLVKWLFTLGFITPLSLLLCF